MEDNDKTREVKLDEIKDVCDEYTSSMIDETVSDMLKFVAYQNDSRFWVNPDEPVDPDYIEYIIDMLSSMISKEIWDTFIGHEELAFRMFLYGTHYIREEELGRS